MMIGKSFEILLVEDNEGDVGLIEEVFEEAKIRNSLHVAEDGEEAETTTDVPENVSIRIYSSSSWRQSLLIFFHSEEAKMMYVFDVVQEELAKSEETGDGVAGVKEPDGGDIENNGRDECEDNEGDDDDEFWNSYKSDM